MPLISVDDADKPMSRPAAVGGGLLRAVLLFGSGLAMLGCVLASLLLYHESKRFDHTHVITTPDPIMTGAIRPDTRPF